MKYVKTFETHLAEVSNSSAEINEAASEVYYTLDWNRDNEKKKYEYVNDMMDLAEKGMKALPDILEETNPDMFDLDSIGFAFKGNAAFVFANIKKEFKPYGVNYSKIEDDKEFRKYFDLASSNLDSYSSKMFSSYFRLDDRKR